ncbi:uncharacterized protein [Lolium perenne]|uniref:uncharacterized protein n=1 Tax=Lolium perenne TaxID=4522 RepID=UPI003A9A0440
MRKLENLLPINFGVTGQETKGIPHMFLLTVGMKMLSSFSSVVKFQWTALRIQVLRSELPFRRKQERRRRNISFEVLLWRRNRSMSSRSRNRSTSSSSRRAGTGRTAGRTYEFQVKDQIGSLF